MRISFIANCMAFCFFKQVLLTNLGKLIMPAYFDLKRSLAQYMYNFKGGNGETVLTSERYAAKQGAVNGIASVKANAPFDGQYRRLTASNGLPYFTLVAGNGETLGTSETYSSVAARETGIASVKQNAPTAPIVDNT